MSKNLPYFRWFPSDAESSPKYRTLSPGAVGLYHRCLNQSWTEDGIPNDVDTLARWLGWPVRTVSQLWSEVLPLFTESQDGKLRNLRLEEERTHATDKSAKASASASKRYANAMRTQIEGTARAYDSDSDSVSESRFELKETIRKEKVATVLASAIDHGFERWWEIWSGVRGTARKNQAVQTWISILPIETEAVIECTRSYLSSLDNPAKGFNPDTFLFEQAKQNFEARWAENRRIKPSNGHSREMEDWLNS